YEKSRIPTLNTVIIIGAVRIGGRVPTIRTKKLGATNGESKNHPFNIYDRGYRCDRVIRLR
ncbi:MAG: hypothetical protein U0K87_05035, partial [Ruminococcus sp.]|nr:hypothetical protein [Ruminococcus sp.]